MNRRLRETAKRYGDRAAVYEKWWAPVLLHLAAPVFEHIPEHARVLDIGAGVGVIASRLARADREVVGVDLSEQMLGLVPAARRRAAGDVEWLPFGAQTFDAAMTTFVLQHVPRAAAVLREAARVLRPGGVFVGMTWGMEHDEDGPADRAIEDALARAGAAPDPLRATTWHAGVDTPAKMRRGARAAGLDLVAAGSARAEHDWGGPEQFLGCRSHIGPVARRLQALSPDARDHPRAGAARGLASCCPADFVWRPELVLLVARRPPTG